MSWIIIQGVTIPKKELKQCCDNQQKFSVALDGPAQGKLRCQKKQVRKEKAQKTTVDQLDFKQDW